MAKPNYSHEKRQRDLAKKKKAEEKRQRKLDRTRGSTGTEENPEQGPDAVEPDDRPVE